MTDPIVTASLITGCSTLLTGFVGGRYSNNKEITNLKKIIKPKYPKIEITYPDNGGRVEKDNSTVIKGTMDGDLPSGTELFVLHQHCGGLYPQGSVSIEVDTNERKTWQSSNYFRGDTKIVVVIAGSGGQSLFEYFGKLHREIFLERNTWIPIASNKLPEDVKIAASISVVTT